MLCLVPVEEASTWVSNLSNVDTTSAFGIVRCSQTLIRNAPRLFHLIPQVSDLARIDDVGKQCGETPFDVAVSGQQGARRFPAVAGCITLQDSGSEEIDQSATVRSCAVETLLPSAGRIGNHPSERQSIRILSPRHRTGPTYLSTAVATHQKISCWPLFDWALPPFPCVEHQEKIGSCQNSCAYTVRNQSICQ